MVRIILNMIGEPRWYYDYGILQETFLEQQYSKLYTAIKPGTVVLDIGANIGDTAIYFSMNSNVKKVYAYEPSLSNYTLAKANIQKTPFSDRIILKKEGVARVDGTIKVNSKHLGTGATRLSDMQDPRGDTLKLVSLNKILSGMKNVVIKCDIEGHEVDIFKGANLSNVYAIQLEYHDCRESVTEDLKKSGFKVVDLNPGQKVGILFASK